MSTPITPTKPKIEEYALRGDDVVAKIKELVREGNIRRIIIKDHKGEIVAEFPLTAGVIGALLAPTLAAVGAIAALAADLTIVVVSD